MKHCNTKIIKNISQSLLETFLVIISDVLDLMEKVNHQQETGIVFSPHSSLSRGSDREAVVELGCPLKQNHDNWIHGREN